RGMGLERVLLSVLALYCDPRLLVLVINVNQTEQELLMEDLTGIMPQHPPMSMTNEQTSLERETLYLRGGVVFVTSRILVVDMLTNRLPMDKVAGLVVANAHLVTPTTSEAFILRLYRHANRVGFIKAVTDNPYAFVSGFNTVERVLRCLWVTKLHIWPRFQRDVIKDLQVHENRLAVFEVPLTKNMARVQQALVRLMSSSLTQLKKLRPSLDMTHLTAESGLFQNFSTILRRQLDGVWHTIGKQTRQLIKDLSTLRDLAVFLDQYDAVTFYHYLQTLRASEYAFTHTSYWVLLDATDDLFEFAKCRVFPRDADAAPGSETEKTDATGRARRAASGIDPAVDRIERNPKWSAYQEQIDIWQRAAEVSPPLWRPNQPCCRTLVLVRDERTARQLRAVMHRGQEYVLNMQLRRYRAWRVRTSRLRPKAMWVHLRQADLLYTSWFGFPSLRVRVFSANGVLKRNSTQASGVSPQADDDSQGELEDEIRADYALPPDEDLAANFGEFGETGFHVIIHAYHREGGVQGSRLARLLLDLQPNNVLIYDLNIVVVRELELHAHVASHPIEVALLTLDTSFQEQQYLSSLRQEKEAFTYVISAKRSMAFPDGRLGLRQKDERQLALRPEDQNVSTRQAGGRRATAGTRPKVIVDMREFRSSLPSILHEFGIDVEPVTLLVGDYVLSPEICVERKSLPDLIGSLKSGRLYNQALQMSQHYPKPILLVEIDESKPYSLVAANESLGSDLEFKTTLARLVLLTLHFPKLRIFWCNSPHSTAQLFYEMKRRGAEPDGEQAAAIGVDMEDGHLSDSRYASEPEAVLRSMPGVTPANVYRIMSGIGSLRELATASQDRIRDLCGGPTLGDQLYRFLQNEAVETSATSSAKGASRN
ncbi:uncharacterized protein MONBRDRAFT_13638, partial [Monosiga brevicollis MX1]